MPLRKQHKGPKQKTWRPEELKAGFEEFFKEYGHYPTSQEIDSYQYLPTSRSIQRQHGGLVALRNALGLGGQDDYRSGVHSSERSLKIGRRANETEQVVYVYLCNKFAKEFVHREFFFTDDARTRVDFFVYDKEGNFCVDVFYPKDKRNLTGCLNSKLLKYTPERMLPYPTIFLQMNSEITENEMNTMLKNKKKPLLKDQYLMGWEAFEAFCAKRTARSSK